MTETQTRTCCVQSKRCWETETRKHQIFVDSRCSGQEEGHVETRAKYFQCCRPGYKHFTKERFEALRKMVDMEAGNGRNSVRYIGTITCDKMRHLSWLRLSFYDGNCIWIEMDVQTTMQTKTEIGSDRHLAV